MDLKGLSDSLFQESLKQEDQPIWPKTSLELLRTAGVWNASLPLEHGGEGVSFLERLRVYSAVACGDLSVALLLVNRDSAVHHLMKSNHSSLQSRVLSAVHDGEAFITVATNHLADPKKSRKLIPFEETRDGLSVSGTFPWVSGGIQAQGLFTGGYLPDGRRVLTWVDLPHAGIEATEPFLLLALNRSCTSSMKCDRLVIPKESIVKGPEDADLAASRPDRFQISTALALGHQKRILIEMQRENLQVRALEALTEKIQNELERLVKSSASEEEALSLRARTNDLVIRSVTVFMIEMGGRAYIRGHRVERLLREAMFFGVFTSSKELARQSVAHLLKDESI